MRTFILAILFCACVNDKPIVDIGREAGTPVIPSIELPEDLPPDDPPNCVSCSKVLQRGLRGGVACVRNAKPSSAAKLGAYVVCACQQQCTAVCGAHCAGAARDTQCNECLQSKCKAAVTACEGEP
jgi:hypothetical protein